MKKMNNHGFTLIEVVISMAITVIASTMLILGFTNVTNLFTESSVIKTETNNLYNGLISEIGSDATVYDDASQLVLTKKESTKLTINSFANLSRSITNPYNIKLTYFDPKLKAQNLPGDSEEPPISYPGGAATVILSKSFKYIPTTWEWFNAYSVNPLYCTSIGIIENCIQDRLSVPGFMTGKYSDVMINNGPTSTQLANKYNELDAEYKKMLNNSYTLRYSAILNYQNKETPQARFVYCFLIPKQKGIYIAYNHDTNNAYSDAAVWIPITKDNSGKETIDKSLIPEYLTRFSTPRNPSSPLTGGDPLVQVFTRSEILDLSFIKELESGETFFAFAASR